METILVIDPLKSIRLTLSQALTTRVAPKCKVQAAADVAATSVAEMAPKLIVLGPSIDASALETHINWLRKAAPNAFIFWLMKRYDLYNERQAITRGISAVFSGEDELESLAQNVKAICELE